MESPSVHTPRFIKLNELQVIKSPRFGRGYSPRNTVILPGDIVEVPKDFVGTNYVNPGEQPNVEYLPDDTFRAIREIAPGEELLTIPYGEGGTILGPRYVGALGAATFPFQPKPPTLENKKKEVEQWHSELEGKSSKKLDVMPEFNTFDEFRERPLTDYEEKVRIFGELHNKLEYDEFSSMGRYGGLGGSRSRQRYGRYSSQETMFPFEPFGFSPYKTDKRRRVLTEQPQQSQVIQRPVKERRPMKQSQEQFFAGPTTRLYRTQGGNRGIAFADVPTPYLNELERRRKKAGQRGVPAQPQRPLPRRPSLIYSLPKINSRGLFWPTRIQRRPVKKKL